MRVESGEHAAHRVLEQLVVLDRLDVVALHAIEDLDEGLQILERQRFARSGRLALGEHAVREGDARADQRAGEDGKGEANARSHGKPLL